mgnify:CR=1 FL=1
MSQAHTRPRAAASSRPMTRRGLFLTLGRLAIGGALAAASGVLLRRFQGRVRTRSDHSCTGRGLCRTCGRSDGCPLPQALSFRAATGKGS